MPNLNFLPGTADYTAQLRIDTTVAGQDRVQSLAQFFKARIISQLSPLYPREQSGDLAILIDSVAMELSFAQASMERSGINLMDSFSDPAYTGTILMPLLPDLTVLDKDEYDRDIHGTLVKVLSRLSEGSTGQSIEGLLFDLLGRKVTLLEGMGGPNHFAADLNMDSGAYHSSSVYSEMGRISKAVDLIKPAHMIFTPRLSFSEQAVGKGSFLGKTGYASSWIKPFLELPADKLLLTSGGIQVTPGQYTMAQGHLKPILRSSASWTGGVSSSAVSTIMEGRVYGVSVDPASLAANESFVLSSIFDPAAMTVRGVRLVERTPGSWDHEPVVYLIDRFSFFTDDETGRRIPAARLYTKLGITKNPDGSFTPPTSNFDKVRISSFLDIPTMPGLLPESVRGFNSWGSWSDALYASGLPNTKAQGFPRLVSEKSESLFNRRAPLSSYEDFSRSSPYLEYFSGRDSSYYQSHGLYVPRKYLEVEKAVLSSVEYKKGLGTTNLATLGGFKVLEEKGESVITVVHYGESISLAKLAMLSMQDLGSWSSSASIPSSNYPAGFCPSVLLSETQANLPTGLSAKLRPGTLVLLPEYTRAVVKGNQVYVEPISSLQSLSVLSSEVSFAVSPKGSSYVHSLFGAGVSPGTLGLKVKVTIKSGSNPFLYMDADGYLDESMVLVHASASGKLSLSVLQDIPEGSVMDVEAPLSSQEPLTDSDRSLVLSRYQEDFRKDWTSSEARPHNLSAFPDSNLELSPKYGGTNKYLFCNRQRVDFVMVGTSGRIADTIGVEDCIAVFAESPSGALTPASRVPIQGSDISAFTNVMTGELSPAVYDMVLSVEVPVGDGTFLAVKALASRDYPNDSYTVHGWSKASECKAFISGIKMNPIKAGPLAATVPFPQAAKVRLQFLSRMGQPQSDALFGSSLSNMASVSEGELSVRVELQDNSMAYDTAEYALPRVISPETSVVPQEYQDRALHYGRNTNCVLARLFPFMDQTGSIADSSDSVNSFLSLVAVGGTSVSPSGLSLLVYPEAGIVRLPFFPPLIQEPGKRLQKASVTIKHLVPGEGSSFAMITDFQSSKLDMDGVSTRLAFKTDLEGGYGERSEPEGFYPKEIGYKFAAPYLPLSSVLDSSDTLTIGSGIGDQVGEIGKVDVRFSPECSKGWDPIQEFGDDRVAPSTWEREGVVPFFKTDISVPVFRKDQNFVDPARSTLSEGELGTQIQVVDGFYSGNVLLRTHMDLSDRLRYEQYGDVDGKVYHSPERSDLLSDLSSATVVEQERGVNIRLSSAYEAQSDFVLDATFDEEYYPDREFRVNDYQDYFKTVSHDVIATGIPVNFISGSTSFYSSNGGLSPNLVEGATISVYDPEGVQPAKNYTLKVSNSTTTLSRAYSPFNSSKMVEKAKVDIYRPMIVDPYMDLSVSRFKGTLGDSYSSLSGQSSVMVSLPPSQRTLGAQFQAVSTLTFSYSLGALSFGTGLSGLPQHFCAIMIKEVGVHQGVVPLYRYASLNTGDLISDQTGAKARITQRANLVAVASSGLTHIVFPLGELGERMIQEMLKGNSSVGAELDDLILAAVKPAWAKYDKDWDSITPDRVTLSLIVGTDSQVVNNLDTITQTRYAEMNGGTAGQYHLNTPVYAYDATLRLDSARIYSGDLVKSMGDAGGQFTGYNATLGNTGWDRSRVAIHQSSMFSFWSAIDGADSNPGLYAKAVVLEVGKNRHLLSRYLGKTTDGFLLFGLDRPLESEAIETPAQGYLLRARNSLANGAGYLTPHSLRPGSSVFAGEEVIPVKGVIDLGVLVLDSEFYGEEGTVDGFAYTVANNSRGVFLDKVTKSYHIPTGTHTALDIVVSPNYVIPSLYNMASLTDAENWMLSGAAVKIPLQESGPQIEPGDILVCGRDHRHVEHILPAGSGEVLLTLSGPLRVRSSNTEGTLEQLPQGAAYWVRISSIVKPSFAPGSALRVGGEVYPILKVSQSVSGLWLIAIKGELSAGDHIAKVGVYSSGAYADPLTTAYPTQHKSSIGPRIRKVDGSPESLTLRHTAIINGSGALEISNSAPYMLQIVDNPGEVGDMTNTVNSGTLNYPYFQEMSGASRQASADTMGIPLADYFTYLDNPSRYFYKLVRWRNWDQMSVRINLGEFQETIGEVLQSETAKIPFWDFSLKQFTYTEAPGGSAYSCKYLGEYAPGDTLAPALSWGEYPYPDGPPSGYKAVRVELLFYFWANETVGNSYPGPITATKIVKL